MTRPGTSRTPALLATVLLYAGLAISGLGFFCGEAPAESGPTASIRDEVVQLEVARTPNEQALGLGNRDGLPWGQGMLFLYDPPGFPTFWMKRMRFDIDIVWIHEGRIVGISAFVPYPREDPDRPATAPAPQLVDRVLEVPAGFAQAKGWRRGDTVVFSGL